LKTWRVIKVLTDGGRVLYEASWDYRSEGAAFVDAGRFYTQWSQSRYQATATVVEVSG